MDTKKLQAYIDSDNIALLLTEERLATIGSDATHDYGVDLQSRSELDALNKEAMKLAKQTYEAKTFPWPDAANVKYPLITTSSIQFASRALPELVPDEKIVNIKVIGEDPQQLKEQRAERVSQYMDYQLTTEIDGWIDGVDRMLHVLPIIGTCFKKVYFDSLTGKVCSEFLTCDDVVVNANAKDMKTARRISHKIYKYNNYVKEMVNANLWLNKELGQASSEDGDTDPPHLFIEQHRWLDLDDDGYQEPYIVTVHEATSQVMRIVTRYDATSLVLKAGALVRIEPTQYFVKYPFIPNPAGGFYDIGFGTLLYPINESINTVINQLLDAGTLANSGGGFLSRGINLGGGEMTFKPGEWKNTNVMGQDLKNGVFPLPIREPSQVLFSLLGLLVTAGKDISSVQEAMTGQKPGENVSLGTVAALIEQGLKVFNSIYKRLYRAFSEEFNLIYKLDSKYLEEETYVKVLDLKVTLSDFDQKGQDIKPSAEPMFSLETQRNMRADALMKISGRPGLDEDAVTALYLKAIRAPKEFLLPQEKRPNPPNIELENLKLKQQELQLKVDVSQLEKLKMFAQVEKLRADAVLSIAKAEAAEEGTQLALYKTFIEELGVRMNESITGGSGGMEGAPRNQGAIQGPGGGEAGVQ